MMKKLLSIFCILGASYFTKTQAQGVINAGQDTAICLPGSVTLSATITNQSPTVLTGLSDDIYAPSIINLGFSFTYFGNTYTQCLISTNNYITFNTSGASTPGGGSPWSITAPIPDAAGTQTHNAILGPWQDLQPNVGGTIRYATVGTAPNRIFVVEYCSVAMYSCNNLQFSSQIQLKENGSVIETHIIDKPVCTTWNSGQAVHGIQNNGGTIAFINAGRNAGVQWSVSNEGTRFQVDPSDPNNYFVSSIPFSPVTLGASGSITWSQVSGPVIGTGANITVSPTVPTSYVASINDLCSGFSYSDTVNVLAGATPDLTFTYPSATFCVDNVTITPILGPGSVGDFSSSPAGLSGLDPITGAFDLGASTPGTYTITRTGDNGGCVGTSSVTINITNAPDPTYSYSTAVFCQGGTTPAPLFIPTSSAGLFTVSPAGLQFLNSNTGEVDLANSLPGTYTVTNTITGFGCPTTTDTSTVTIASQSVSAGVPLSTCTGLGALLQGLATGPNSGNIVWSGGTGVFSSPNNDTTYYDPSLNDAGVGFVNLVLTMNGTPACPTIFSIIPLTVELGALATAGNDVVFCGSSAPIILNGSVGGLGSSGTWSTNGTGSFGNSGTLSTVYTPSTDDITNGSIVIYLTTNDPVGNCPPAVDSLLVTFGQQPVVTAQMQGTVICAGSNASLSVATSGTVTSYTWTSTGSGSFTTPNSASTQYTPSAADVINGSVTFTVNAVAPAPCSSVSSTVTATLVPAPTAVISGGGVVQTGSGTTCPNGTSAPVSVTLTGAGPWTISFAVGQDTITANNIATSPFIYQDSIPGAFTIVTLGDLGACPGLITGSAVIDTVNIRYLALSKAETCGEVDGLAVVLNTSGGTAPYSYLWSNGISNDSISGLLTGNYSVTVTEASNCFSTQNVFVPQVLGVVASATADPMTGQYPVLVNFSNNSTGATTYLWNFGDGSDSTAITSPTHTFETQGTYYVVLTAYNTPSCSISDTLTIIVDGEVPNIFTPNGDGKNDIFSVNQLSAKMFTAQIYNRWGRKVYEWTDPKGGWDGAGAEAGVYYYVVDYTTQSNKAEQMHGTITLLK